MNNDYVLMLSDEKAVLANVGGKGASLARLTRAGLPVPDGFYVTTTAYQQFVEINRLQAGVLQAVEAVEAASPASLEAASRAIQELFVAASMPPEVAGAVARAYAALPGTNPAVAVRSSATAEDLPELSFAGQQETYLNIQGAAQVLEAVKHCWASLWTPRAIGYRQQHGIDQRAVSLAVVVQLLIPAEAAGILFTADPVTGLCDRELISAAWGLGEAVVGGLVTPDSLVVEKESGRILDRQTADKQVMTVRVDGSVEQQPVPEDLRRAPTLDDSRAAELSRLGVQIESLYGVPMDVEWALADGNFAILQARPITALPQLETPLPSEWAIPDPKSNYARGSLAEHLPNPVSPLFATLGLRLASEATNKLMQSFMGKDAILFSFCVINGYVYLGIRMGPKEMWKFTKMTLLQLGTVLRGSKQNWLAARAPFAEVVRSWESRPIEGLTSTELLAGVRQLTSESVKFYTVIQSGTLPTATSSETTFTQFYERLVRRDGDPKATSFLFGFDTIPILAEKSLFDLAGWCRGHPSMAEYVLRTPAERLTEDLSESEPPTGISPTEWADWQNRFQEHLRAYGSSVYDFDFANPVPVEAPQPLLEAIKMYLAGKGNDPYERQRAAAERRDQATQQVLARIGWPRRNLFQKLVKWAQETCPVREDSLADMGMAHPQIRRLLGELGRRFVSGGALVRAEDIYWLEEGEVKTLVAALDHGEPLPDFASHIPPRKSAWRAAQKLLPPAMLPEKSRWAKLMPWSEQRQGDQLVLKGFGASAGRVTAPACVLLGPEDFSKLHPGAVLVAVTTTPAWTPLFAMASAVVTDIGGPLSHSSIVAREYGIPAVLATGVATRRIQSGQMITVDGGAGSVTIKR